MEEGFKRDTCAEVALSAMVSMIMILLFSALVAGMALMMIEQAFMESRTQSVEQSETLNSVPLVLVFEVEQLDTTGNTNDQLYLMFKFPFAGDTIADTNVKWAMMCDINDTGPPQTSSAHTLVYSSGNFDVATDLNGNANDAASLDEFNPQTYYHVLIDLTSPNGNGDCDLVEDMHATLVIAVEKGRTVELDFYVPDDVTPGYDLMS
ncbi:MAG: hypothetical protein QGF34_00010 [Candidatus Poseidoniaceae archaeon]|nr:hypothetical protein [Candidatus Poseidoniaceae archaeon]